MKHGRPRVIFDREMNLFRIFFLPLAYALFVSVVWGRSEPKYRINAFIRGCIGFVPALIVFLIVRNLVGMDYATFGLWAGVLFRDTALWSALACGAFALFYRFGEGGTEENRRNLLAFMCGFMSLVGLFEWIAGGAHASLYSLFLLPVMRAALVLALSAFVARAAEGALTTIALFVFLSLAFIAASGFVGYFWLTFRYLYGLLSFAALGACGWFAYRNLA